MAKGAYIGISSKARKVKKMYIGIGGVARKVKKAYIGVGGVARLFWSGGGGAQKAILQIYNDASVYSSSEEIPSTFSANITNPLAGLSSTGYRSYFVVTYNPVYNLLMFFPHDLGTSQYSGGTTLCRNIYTMPPNGTAFTARQWSSSSDYSWWRGSSSIIVRSPFMLTDGGYISFAGDTKLVVTSSNVNVTTIAPKTYISGSYSGSSTNAVGNYYVCTVTPSGSYMQLYYRLKTASSSSAWTTVTQYPTGTINYSPAIWYRNGTYYMFRYIENVGYDVYTSSNMSSWTYNKRINNAYGNILEINESTAEAYVYVSNRYIYKINLDDFSTTSSDLGSSNSNLTLFTKDGSGRKYMLFRGSPSKLAYSDDWSAWTFSTLNVNNATTIGIA